MRYERSIWLATAALSTMSAAGAAQARSAGTQVVEPGEAGTEADQSNEIVVTASKREEKLRDVPAAVTALGSDTIENQGIRDFRDYSSLVPGLSQRDFGGIGQGTIILRGMNTGPQQTTNTAAFYIDDAAYSASGFFSVGAILTPSPDLADVERIEVLKGPQGTLYGASSLGGIVRVITKQADPSRFSGMMQLEGETLSHGNEGGAVRGAVNVPIVPDVLAVRVSGFYRKAAGFTDNVQTGERDANTGTIKGGRIALRFTPTDRLTVDVNGFYQDIRHDLLSFQDNVKGTTRPLSGPYRLSFVPGAGGSDIEYRSVSGTASYSTDAGSIVGAVSHVESKAAITTDYTNIYGTYLAMLGRIPARTQTVGYLDPVMKKATAELRFVSSRLGPVEFVAGGFYTHEDNTYPFRIIARSPDAVPLPAPADLLYRTVNHSVYDEYALFGNLTYYLTDQLDITGGIRWARNEQSSRPEPGIVFYAPNISAPSDFSDSSTTYLATLRYRPTSNVSLFVRAASGYRPGGPQNVNPLIPPEAQDYIRADNVWNYEAGIKATALDGALSANLSVYRIDWKDIQLNAVLGSIAVLANAGSAKIDGFEAELVARLSRDLTVGANIGYTNPRITSIGAEAAGSLGAKKGDKLPLTPAWTIATYLDQIVPLSDSARGSFGATLRFQSDMPSSYPGYALNPNIKVPSITTVDLRAGVDWERFGLQVRVSNLFDTLGYATLVTNALYAAQPVPTTATTIRPRAFTLSATARF